MNDGLNIVFLYLCAKIPFVSKNNQHWLWFFSLLALFVVACKQEEKAIETFTKEEIQVETIKKVDMFYSDSAVVRVRVRGPVMLRHTALDNPKQEFIKGIWVDFYRGGRVVATLTAKYAERNEYSGITLARDSVVWRSTDGKRLESPELTWDEKQQKVYTNRFVVVTTPKDTIYSQGILANQDFTDIEFKAVDGSMMVKDPGK